MLCMLLNLLYIFDAACLAYLLERQISGATTGSLTLVQVLITYLLAMLQRNTIGCYASRKVGAPLSPMSFTGLYYLSILILDVVGRLWAIQTERCLQLQPLIYFVHIKNYSDSP